MIAQLLFKALFFFFFTSYSTVMVWAHSCEVIISPASLGFTVFTQVDNRSDIMPTQWVDGRKAKNTSPRLGVATHLLPSLLEGGFSLAGSLLPEIKEGGNLIVLFGSSLTQTGVKFMPDGRGGWTPNLAFYWVRDHSSVDPSLGGDQALEIVINQARQLGIKVWLDMVYNHYGYGTADLKIIKIRDHDEQIDIDEKTQLIRLFGVAGISTFQLPFDPKEFVFDGTKYSLEELVNLNIIRPLDTPCVSNQHWNEMNYGIHDFKDPRFLALWDDMSSLSLFGLHGLQHNNSIVMDYLVKSFGRFLDIGVSGFRLDAALYVNRHATTDLINRINLRQKNLGMDLPQFLIELLVTNDTALASLMDDLLSRITDSQNIYFLDFPQMSEVRRIHDDPVGYQLRWYLGFLNYRRKVYQEYRRLVPTPVNHDFGYYLRDKNLEQVVYALTEFTSQNPSLNYLHAGIQSGFPTNRKILESYNNETDPINHLIFTFYQAMDPYRSQVDFLSQLEFWTGSDWRPLSYIEMTEPPLSQVVISNGRNGYLHHEMVLRIKGPQSSLYLFAKKNVSNSSLSLALTEPPSSLIREIYQYGDVKMENGQNKIMTSNPNQLILNSTQPGVLLFEVIHQQADQAP